MILDLTMQSSTELSQETTLAVAEAMTAAEDEGVRVKCSDQKIDKILKARDQRRLAENADQLKSKS